MTFCIITHVPHVKQNEKYFAYAPYVREMNLWLKYVDEVIVVAPLYNEKISAIDLPYTHNRIVFKEVVKFNFLNLKSVLSSFVALPKITFEIYKAMQSSDHIHLRCPGNMGLIGCIVQIFFPSKSKTAKYAGNWDKKAKQPFSYKLQKWILSNTFLTKNMQVLVYGEWENNSKNVKPFFTASYFEKDKTEIQPRQFTNKIQFLFVGTLSNGKQPLYAVKLVEQLHKNGNEVELNIYGEGIERAYLEKYILENKLESIVFLKGNQNQETIKKAYLKNHFVVLPSLSEGWPKVVAEGMFWGCVPLATSVSCLPNMLDNGNRGVLLELNLEKDVKTIQSLLKDNDQYQAMADKSIKWSRNYTLDIFEEEIKLLLQS